MAFGENGNVGVGEEGKENEVPSLGLAEKGFRLFGFQIV
ncbi:hypothetical protein OROGR_013712 [Orobanche gracilis]